MRDQDMENFFQDFFQQLTPEIIKEWEETIEKNKNARMDKYLNVPVRTFLPFVRRVIPRIGKMQSIHDLSIICLHGSVDNESEIVQYGLEPLLAAGILTQEDVKQITLWYQKTDPTRDSGWQKNFEKEFEIEDVKYLLTTDSYGGFRDLNLQVLTR